MPQGVVVNPTHKAAQPPCCVIMIDTKNAMWLLVRSSRTEKTMAVLYGKGRRILGGVNSMPIFQGFSGRHFGRLIFRFAPRDFI